VDLSRLKLERSLQKYLNCAPSRYYLRLRLIRARQLLKQTSMSMSIIELTAACGFVFTPHFSECYRGYFGVSPSDERRALQLRRQSQARHACHRSTVMGATGHSVRPGTKRIDICERPHEPAPHKLDRRPTPMPPRRLTVNTPERHAKYRIG
jgi:AraC-like DNA-binding protein